MDSYLGRDVGRDVLAAGIKLWSAQGNGDTTMLAGNKRTHTHIYPRRGINPRDGRCFRGIISFGSGSWLTWTTVHSGRRLSAFRFPLFPPSPQTSCTPLFFYLTANFLPRFLSASLGAPFGKRVYMASLCERGGYSIFFSSFFFSLFFFFDKSAVGLIGEREWYGGRGVYGSLERKSR